MLEIKNESKILEIILGFFLMREPRMKAKTKRAYIVTRGTTFPHPKKEFIGSTPKKELIVSTNPKTVVATPSSEIFILKLSSFHLPQRKNIKDDKAIVKIKRTLGELKA
jgi:hypothetical protein